VAVDGWQCFREATKRKKWPCAAQKKSSEIWLLPREMLYKANVDVALDKGTWKRMWTNYPRLKCDQIVAACVKTEAKWGAEITEAYAVFRGLKITWEAGVQDLVMESDALRVVRALQGSKRRSYASIFIDKALSLVPWFNVISFFHVNRSANRVAHELAKHALSLDGKKFG